MRFSDKKMIKFTAKSRSLFAALLLVLLFAGSAFSQATEPDKKDLPKEFTAYTELNLDMEVKVQSGSIRIWRSWEGDTKSWTIQPQQEPLTLSDDKEGDAYGEALAKEISKGPRKWTQSSLGLFKRASISSTQSSGSAPSDVPAQIGILANKFQLNYCTNEGERAIEMLAASPGGYKWINRIGRQWAQYDFNGLLIEWGMGSYRTAQVLYDTENNVKGYADTFDNEVITVERDTEGRIKKITDYEGREVSYTYNAQGLVEDVVDPEGVVTHYEYTQGNITLKRVGDSSATTGDEIPGDQSELTFTYYSPAGELQSIYTEDGTSTEFEYKYNDQTKVFTTIQKTGGNKTIRTERNLDDGIVSVKQNGEYKVRVVHLCEDTAIFDKHNRMTYIDRDDLGIIKEIIFPDERKLSFTHTAENWPEMDKPWDVPAKPWGLIKANIPDGREIEYERDINGKIVTAIETAPDGSKRYWSFGYDSYGNKTEERFQAAETPDDSKDQVNKWVYDAYGNVQYYQDGVSGSLWQFEYNSRGDVTKIIAPDLNEWVMTYTGKGKLKSITNPVGYKQVFDYTKKGLLKRFHDFYDTGKVAVTQYFYNKRGLVTRINDPFGEDWTYEYTGADELRIETDPLGKKTTYEYDARSRVTKITDGNGVDVTLDYFDTAPPGQATQTEIAFSPRVHINYPTYTRELQYDLSDRLVIDRMKPAQGSVQETKYEYDKDSRLKTLLRPDGKKIEYQWDALSRPISITVPGSGTTTIEYPEAARKIIYHDAVGGTTEYQFDYRGLLLSEKRADDTIVSYEYNVNGDVKSYTSAKGHVHKLFYDAAHRVERVEIYPDSLASTPSRVIQFGMNLRGDVISITEPDVTQNYAYDDIGRVLQASTAYQAGFTKSHSYTYAANGVPATYTDIAGVTQTYLWDPANQFQGVVIPGTGSVTFNYTKEDFDQPVAVNFPGGAKQTFEYDDLRRLKRLKSTDQVGTSLLDYNYTYQDGSLIGGAVKEISTEHGDYSYNYDESWRVTDAEYPNLSEDHFTYDEIGRRQPLNGTPWVYSTTGGVLDTSIAQYTYDTDGNRLTKTEGGVTTKYNYDERDRLISIEEPLGTVVVEYQYDEIGRRLSKTVSGVTTYYYYTEDGLAAELDSSGNIEKSYLYAPGSSWSTAPLSIKEGASRHYVHVNHLGAPAKLTNKNGAVSWEATYDAYGSADVSSLGVTNNLRLPGQYFDVESGLSNNFQRNYDSALGAYIEHDPYGVLVTGANRYVYGGGDPVNLYDPTGEIVPIIVGVVWVASAVYTGFEVYQCYEYIRDG
ncbi:MAG: RHS repeat protein, partial [Bdellovibrionales bacterium]|nr:RHS repeat protein [Bdellovibrionales bacterium]